MGAEEQATADAFADLTSAMNGLNTIISAADAGGAAWDNATPAQRTGAIRIMARSVRALAILMNGCRAPLGNARVPDYGPLTVSPLEAKPKRARRKKS